MPVGAVIGAAIGEAMFIAFLVFMAIVVLLVSTGVLTSVVAMFERKGFLQAVKVCFRAWGVHFFAMLTFTLVPVALVSALALLMWVFAQIVSLFSYSIQQVIFPIFLLPLVLLPFILVWFGLAAYMAYRDICGVGTSEDVSIPSHGETSTDRRLG